MKKVYDSELKGPNKRGRPHGRWKDRVEEYLGETAINVRGVFEQARRECLDRERWRLFCRGHPKKGHSWRKRVITAIDR